MWRSRAVRSLLVEEVGGLRIHPPEPGDAAAEAEEQAAVLRQARRRAALVVAADWTALALLFLFRDRQLPFFPTTAPEVVFTLGVLLLAVHSGFRLGQLEKYRAVDRAYRELAERAPEAEGDGA